MKNTLLATFLLGTIVIAGCTMKTGSVDTTNTGTVMQTGVVVEQSPITQINIYQVQLEGTTGSATGAMKMIGCNDTLVELPVKVDMTEVNKYPETWKAIMDYDFENKGLMNPWKNQDAVQFESYEIQDKVLVVNLSGTVKIGGICDVPRLEETVKATYKNFGYDDVRILVNGQNIQ